MLKTAMMISVTVPTNVYRRMTFYQLIWFDPLLIVIVLSITRYLVHVCNEFDLCTVNELTQGNFSNLT